jgi:long-chain acyl-CoA synthetase
MHKFETLTELFDTSVSKYPDRELFGTKVDGAWQWTTYLAFGRAVERARAGLARLGVGAGDRVAIIANNRVEWAVVQYACFGLGAALVPMYEAQSAKEWVFILDDCAARVVVCATEAIAAKILAAALKQSVHVIGLDTNTQRSERVSTYADLTAPGVKVAAFAPTKNQLACIIYTSGTTGNPKGVMLSHGNIASNVVACHQRLSIDADNRSLSFLPWAHVFGQTCELHLLLAAGASIALCESVDKLVANLAEVRPTFLMSVPRVFNRMYTNVNKQIAAQPKWIQELVARAFVAATALRNGETVALRDRAALVLADKLVFAKVRKRFGGRLQFAMSGGAALSPEVASFLSTIGITVLEGYGLTETAPVVCVNYPGAIRIGTVGKALPQCRVEIAESGEIVAYGPNIMLGYFNRPDDTAVALTADGGFRTGDMGRLDDGFLTITGRIKELYKLENGKYVVPTPLEEAFKLSAFVANAFVYGDNRPFNVALIVPNFDAVRSWGRDHGLAAETPAQLAADAKVHALLDTELKRVGAAFKGYEGIKAFALVAEDFTTENGQLTPTLKVKRRAITECYQTRIDALYTQKQDGAA